MDNCPECDDWDVRVDHLETVSEYFCRGCYYEWTDEADG